MRKEEPVMYARLFRKMETEDSFLQNISAYIAGSSFECVHMISNILASETMAINSNIYQRRIDLAKSVSHRKIPRYPHYFVVNLSVIIALKHIEIIAKIKQIMKKVLKNSNQLFFFCFFVFKLNNTSKLVTSLQNSKKEKRK